MYNAHWIHSLPYSKFIELTLTLDDVIGATGTHESVHALDKYSNHVGQPDKSKREQNPILKEIEYIKKIKH